MSTTTPARRLRRLCPELLVVLWTSVRVEFLLRRRELPVVCQRLGVVLDVTDATLPTDAPAVLPAWTRGSVRATDVVLRAWPFGDTCLRRCLVLGARLSGLTPALRIGARRLADGAVVAHAWLEIDHRSLDAHLEGIAPLARPWPAA